jgi:hypothetical protein
MKEVDNGTADISDASANCVTLVGTMEFTSLDLSIISSDVIRDATAGELANFCHRRFVKKITADLSELNVIWDDGMAGTFVCQGEREQITRLLDEHTNAFEQFSWLAREKLEGHGLG